MATRPNAEAPTQALALRMEDQLANVDWGQMTETGPQVAPFGIFGWYHGNKAGKTAGAFYGKETEFAEMPGDPWAPDDRFNEGKTPEVGFSASQLRIAVIGWRSQWFKQDADDDRERKHRHWLPAYQEGVGAKKQVEWLCFVEGVSAPMILAGSKMTKTKPFTDIIEQYRRTLLKQASLKLQRPLPTWFHWLPIGCERSADGKPVYTEVSGKDGKSSFVTYPKLYLPANASDALFVGPELLMRGAQIRRDFAWWLEEVRLPDNTVEAEFEIEEAEPPRRNVPQAVESDEDLPF